jgi:hypothetical protein
MGNPPQQYKLSSASQHAQTPQWLLDTLRSEHGPLHDPCPMHPTTDGLQTQWSSTHMNFVNPPFSDASLWLNKAVEEAQKHNNSSIVLVPFRPHTRYMWLALQHAASVCLLSKPIKFHRSNDGEQFNRPLPTPVCLVSFGNTNLAPSISESIGNASFARLRTSEASFASVAQTVFQCTGKQCETIASPMNNAALRYGCSAILCAARVTNNAVQELLVREAKHVVFLSPPLKAKESHRCVEGSLLAFFSSDHSAFVNETCALSLPFSLLHPQSCTRICG